MAEVAGAPLMTQKNNRPETSDGPAERGYIPIFGQYRHWKDFSKSEASFYCLSLVLRLGSLGFTLYKLGTWPTHLDDYTFAIIMAVTLVFCIFHIVHGVHTESWPHLVANFVTSSAHGIYTYIQWESFTSYFVEETTGIKVRLVLSILLLIVSAVLLYPLVKKYYRKGTRRDTVGSSEDNPAQRAHLTWVFMCRCLITFELQIQVTVLFFVLETGLDMTLVEGIILVTGLHSTIVWVIAGFATVRTKSMCWLIAFLLLWLRSLAYIVYKLIRLPSLAPSERWTPLYIATLVCLGLNILSKVTLAGTLAVVVRNFRKDVKDARQEGCRAELPLNNLGDPPAS
ncbi:uncharacterized protein LOC144178933 isoform X1 [Haemaphysalis longicornis]